MVTENTMHTCIKIHVFLKTKIRFVTVLDLNKTLEQSSLPISLRYPYAPIAKLPSKI